MKWESHIDIASPLFVADELALDFMNTQFGVGERRQDYLDSDARVLDWLQRAGVPTFNFEAKAQRGALLEAALALRESARGLLERRKRGEVGNPAVLNRLLALDNSYLQLVWSKQQSARREQHRRVTSVEALLVPVAQALVTLIAEADFSLVRECESSDCTLWFYDRTKSHRRRWCSMALCGNRMKVAAFRARKKTE
ncbi:MAG: ABATE domain-containing protein [Pseudomonadota bacterium]|nr:ABATE domain-containing protein [Pseudomonadota bacterium]